MIAGITVLNVNPHRRRHSVDLGMYGARQSRSDALPDDEISADPRRRAVGEGVRYARQQELARLGQKQHVVGLVQDEPASRVIRRGLDQDGAGMRLLDLVQPSWIGTVRPLVDATRGSRQDVVEGSGQSPREGSRARPPRRSQHREGSWPVGEEATFVSRPQTFGEQPGEVEQHLRMTLDEVLEVRPRQAEQMRVAKCVGSRRTRVGREQHISPNASDVRRRVRCRITPVRGLTAEMPMLPVKIV